MTRLDVILVCGKAHVEPRRGTPRWSERLLLTATISCIHRIVPHELQY